MDEAAKNDRIESILFASRCKWAKQLIVESNPAATVPFYEWGHRLWYDWLLRLVGSPRVYVLYNADMHNDYQVRIRVIEDEVLMATTYIIEHSIQGMKLRWPDIVKIARALWAAAGFLDADEKSDWQAVQEYNNQDHTID